MAMGLGNDPPVITSVTANPNPVFPGGQSGLTCVASDPDGAVTQYEWTADAGTFPNGTTSQVVPAPENTIVWAAPAETGYGNITVTVYDGGGGYGGPPATATQYLSILVDGQNNSPIITSLVPETDSVFPGESIFIIASAIDPDGDPFAFQWSASRGTITGDADADPEAIIWTAPQTGGDCTITATVTDGLGGQGSSSVGISVSIALEAGYIRTPGANPVRIATDSSGKIYVSDSHRNRVLVYNEVGDFVRQIRGLDAPLGVAVGPDGRLYVGEDGKDRVSIYNTSGSLLGTLGSTAVQMPNGIAVDPVLHLIFVVDSKTARVLIFDSGGSLVHVVDGSLAVQGGFIFPVGAAIDAASQTLYVTDAGRYKVYGLDYAGNLKSSFGSMGRGNGKFTRPQGIAVDGQGRVFAVDVFQSYIQVFDSGGQFVAALGSFGKGRGNLSVPLDACVDQFDRLLVTSNDNSRIEIFSLTEDIIPLPNIPPTEPTPYLPLDWAEVATRTPDLVALPATDADGDTLLYEFEIYESGELDPYALVSGVLESVGQVSWSVAPSLRENTFYEWKTRATDGLGPGPWALKRVFFVNAVNDSPLAPAGVVTLPGAELRPDGALEWLASADPDAFDQITYVLEIDDDPDFSSVLIREENIQTNSITLKSLTQYSLLVDETMYYWRVKAVDNHGAESDWANGSFYFNWLEIHVFSTPEGAGVYIDGNPAYPGWKAQPGSTPMTVTEVEQQLHVVTIKKAGYDDYTTIVDNRPGIDAQVVATLSPAARIVPGSPRIYSMDSFLQSGVTRSRPFLVDWNYDATMDMLLSDDSGLVRLVLGGERPSEQGILLDTAAVFGVPVRDATVFAVDWDNDSDFDLLIGTRSDGILLAINTGGQLTPAFANGGKIQVLGRDPLSFATNLVPVVVDWNDDGRKDMIVGCSSGLIGLYINSGTDKAPEFAVEQYVEADGELVLAPSGYAVPFVADLNADGLPDLLTGGWGGKIQLHLNGGTAGDPVLARVGVAKYFIDGSTRLTANPGPRSAPYLADWNGDGLRELVCGNENGDVVLYPGLGSRN